MRRRVGYDSETELVAPGRQAPRLVCGSFYDEATKTVSVELREATADKAAELLVDQEVELVGLNIAFDLCVLCQHDPDRFFPLVFGALDDGRIFDVGVFETLRCVSLGRLRSDPELGGRPPSFSLAELVEKYLGRDRYLEKKDPAAWRSRYIELDGIPVSEWPPEAVSYCEDDARDPVLIRSLQLKTSEELPLFREAVRHAFAFALLRARGIRTERAAVEALEARLKRLVAEAEPKLVEAGILRKNGSQDKRETQRRILALLGDETPITKTGRNKLAEGAELDDAFRLKYTKTDEETLEQCTGLDEALDLWSSVKRDRKELSDFVPKLKLGVELPICARWNPIVASFRSSCRGPNLQQQPRRSGVRETFVPRPGFLFCSADYHVAELVSLGQCLIDLFGFSAMAEELRLGRDLHVVFAAELAGLGYDEAFRRYKAGDKRLKELRQAAKAASFGIPGGLGVEKLRAFAKGYGVELTEDETRELRDQWLDRFPEMRRYFRWISNQCAGGSFTHRHPRTGFVRGDVGYCDGANQGFQHLTAAGAKDALVEVVRACYNDPTSPLFGSFPVLFIHDEIVAEVPEEKAHDASFELSRIMVEAMARYTPDIPPRATPALMRRWYKDAEDVYVDGRLVPWEPSQSKC